MRLKTEEERLEGDVTAAEKEVAKWRKEILSGAIKVHADSVSEDQLEWTTSRMGIEPLNTFLASKQKSHILKSIEKEGLMTQASSSPSSN